MRSIILVSIWAFVFMACEKNQDGEENSFLVKPVVAVLKAGESFTFTAPFAEIQVSLSEELGHFIEERTYQAPDFIEENKEIEILIQANDQQAKIPVFLLKSEARKDCYAGGWEEYSMGEKVLEMNVWGMGERPINELDLCIFDFEIEEQSVFGWRWHTQNNNSAIIQCYPEIIYGWKPWRNQSTNNQLPRVVSGLKKVDLNYEAMSQAFGTHNFTFDLWITDADNVNLEVVKAEIMIWESWREMRPLGELKEVLRTPFGDYEFWSGTTQTWDYHAFRRVEARTQGNLEATWFLDFLKERGYLRDDQFLASIEFGNEVATGEGITVLKKYEVNIK